MKAFLIYLVWPNPGNASYGSPKIQILLVACALLILLSFTMSFWRRNMRNPVTKRLSRTWPSAAFWFGLIGLVLVVSRVESIGFLAMRLWWVILAAVGALYLFLQYRIFRARHYQQMPREFTDDPREKYLPRKKK
ncbi:MAG: hypothetical protein PHE68_03060 [Candidatus Peribacteraceae bacterium]|nr:hypothetical protein [Candidatus Peribacteraceae bacterium]MDD5074253.1 hypothetical protein [Candidatus Peribacteraceae bacterium]